VLIHTYIYIYMCKLYMYYSNMLELDVDILVLAGTFWPRPRRSPHTWGKDPLGRVGKVQSIILMPTPPPPSLHCPTPPHPTPRAPTHLSCHPIARGLGAGGWGTGGHENEKKRKRLGSRCGMCARI
jgi:hypothetical protein